MHSHLVFRFFHKHTHTHTHPTQSSAHKHTNADSHALPLPSPPLSSTVYIKAVSNCTLSLIGSAVQCAAVDSDKSFFQSPEECLPTAMSEDTGGEKKLIVPWPPFKRCRNGKEIHRRCRLALWRFIYLPSSSV